MDAKMQALKELSGKRWRFAFVLTVLMLVFYFGFIALVAYGREFLKVVITNGLTMGVMLGALVIISAWILTYIYVRWANTSYDASVARLRR